MLFKKRKPKTSSGFTLVELLVVIGIIAVLVSLLLPALTKARAQAQEIKCLSNMHQLALQMIFYAADNKDYYPSTHITNHVSYYVPGTTTGNRYPVWDGLLRKRNDDWTAFTGTWSNVTADGVYLCPSQIMGDTAVPVAQYVRSYAMNGNIANNVWTKRPWVLNSGSCLLLTEFFLEKWDNPTNATLKQSDLTQSAAAWAYYKPLLNCHQNRFNVLYCDFHAAVGPSGGNATSQEANETANSLWQPTLSNYSIYNQMP